MCRAQVDVDRVDPDDVDELGNARGVALSNVPPAAHRLSSEKVLAIANRLPEMRALRKEYRGSFGDVYLKGAFQWQVSYFTRTGKKEIGLVIINDLSGRWSNSGRASRSRGRWRAAIPARSAGT